MEELLADARLLESFFDEQLLLPFEDVILISSSPPTLFWKRLFRELLEGVLELKLTSPSVPGKLEPLLGIFLANLELKLASLSGPSLTLWPLPPEN